MRSNLAGTVNFHLMDLWITGGHTFRKVAVFLLAMLLSGLMFLAAGAQDPFDKVVEIGVQPGQMMYDKETFSVPAGGRIKLIFDNTNGTLQHNLLILVPGEESSALDLAQETWEMQNPISNDYVPESDQVLFHTALLGPGETETIKFQAPEKPGDHPYVCTMPGHAQTMNGMMHVREPETKKDDTSTSTEPTSDDVPGNGLAYRLFHGKWKKLPSFEDLKPVRTGVIRNGKVSLKPRKRDEYFGMVFEGTLEIPKTGLYQFYLASDGASRLMIDGKEVVYNPYWPHTKFRLNGPGNVYHPSDDHLRKQYYFVTRVKPNRVSLKKGKHALRLEYVRRESGMGLQLGMRTPDGSMTYLSREKGQFDPVDEVTISSSPRVFRCRLIGSSPHSIAVGLPSGIHYCFDADFGVLRYGWTGRFLDVGPMRGFSYRGGRGGLPANVLGHRFALGTYKYGQPIRPGAPDEKPDFTFEGYLNDDPVPTTIYRLDGMKVRQRVRSADEERGIIVTYRLKNAPEAQLYYRIDRSDVQVSASEGKWINDSTLKLSETDSFQIRILNPK